ncbi:MAG TPA: hypothetical protein VGM76_12200 [Lacipirellulaceae bacterium]|jgi:hypothetical protein
MYDESSTPDDVLFDRLVDGELSAAERRELLGSLDGRPTGWRRCALAFLEAQTWQDEFGRLVREKAAPEEVAAEKINWRSTERLFAGRPITTWFALAASVMLAFTLGLALRDFSLPHPFASPNPFNNQSGSGPTFAGVGNPADALTFWAPDKAGKPQPLQVPLVDAAAMDRQMGLRFQSSVPAAVRAQLERNGYQVETRRRYAPLFLSDGRRLMVPVEDIQIVPVGTGVY